MSIPDLPRRAWATFGKLNFYFALSLFATDALAQTTPSELAAQAPTPSAAELETQRARIGEIRIANGNVFATELPEENKALFRLANRLHIKTREETIRQQLLFKSGDLYVERLVRESERILRSNRYLYDAEIVPISFHDGVVDVEVRTRDVWTFKPGISYGRSGGKNSTGFELQESNLLGYGKEITLSHRNDVDRTSDELRYFDPQLLNTHARATLSYETNSDGRLREATVDRPFYSLDSRWMVSVDALDWQRTDQRYVLGNPYDEFRHNQQRIELMGGTSPGWQSGWIKRFIYGAAFTQDRFAPTDGALSATTLPEDRKFAYPFAGFTIFEDNYERRRNEDQIERTEDLYTGTSLQARFGWASASYGSKEDAAVVSILASTSIESELRRHTVVFQYDAAGRLENGALRNGVMNLATRYYWRVAERQLFYASLSGSLTHELDTDRQLTLGGDSGLRGYPLRYQQGSASALLTLEHRIYTKYYLFRLFHVGGAVFFDAGRTWGRGTAPTPLDTNLGMLKDAGIGLRFGSSRSAFGNVIHVDLAFPLDGDPSIKRVQFVVETKTSF